MERRAYLAELTVRLCKYVREYMQIAELVMCDYKGSWLCKVIVMVYFVGVWEKVEVILGSLLSKYYDYGDSKGYISDP